MWLLRSCEHRSICISPPVCFLSPDIQIPRFVYLTQRHLSRWWIIMANNLTSDRSTSCPAMHLWPMQLRFLLEFRGEGWSLCNSLLFLLSLRHHDRSAQKEDDRVSRSFVVITGYHIIYLHHRQFYLSLRINVRAMFNVYFAKFKQMLHIYNSRVINVTLKRELDKNK